MRTINAKRTTPTVKAGLKPAASEIAPSKIGEIIAAKSPDICITAMT
jgi:hypothetical protein